MIDRLAELIVHAAAHLWIFLRNPTASPWLDFLRVVVPALVAMWLLRAVVLVIRGDRLARSGATLGEDRERVRARLVRAARRWPGGPVPRALRRVVCAGAPRGRARRRGRGGPSRGGFRAREDRKRGGAPGAVVPAERGGRALRNVPRSRRGACPASDRGIPPAVTDAGDGEGSRGGMRPRGACGAAPGSCARRRSLREVGRPGRVAHPGRHGAAGRLRALVARSGESRWRAVPQPARL